MQVGRQHSFSGCRFPWNRDKAGRAKFLSIFNRDIQDSAWQRWHSGPMFADWPKAKGSISPFLMLSEKESFPQVSQKLWCSSLHSTPCLSQSCARLLCLCCGNSLGKGLDSSWLDLSRPPKLPHPSAYLPCFNSTLGSTWCLLKKETLFKFLKWPLSNSISSFQRFGLSEGKLLPQSQGDHHVGNRSSEAEAWTLLPRHPLFSIQRYHFSIIPRFPCSSPMADLTLCGGECRQSS